MAVSPACGFWKTCADSWFEKGSRFFFVFSGLFMEIFFGLRYDPYANLAKVTGMATSEAVCESFFGACFMVFGLLVFGPRSVTQSVNPTVRPRQSTRLASVPVEALGVYDVLSLKQAWAVQKESGGVGPPGRALKGLMRLVCLTCLTWHHKWPTSFLDGADVH